MRSPVSFWTFLAFVPALWAHSNLTIAGIVVDNTRAHLPAWNWLAQQSFELLFESQLARLADRKFFVRPCSQ